MCLFLSLISNLFSSPEKIGSIGEKRLEKKLDLMDFFGYNGISLKNIYVPKADGTTSEIDLLYITQKGIFVIESKNYSGYIFGNENNKNWTVTYYIGKNFWGKNQIEKDHFYNPIWQNRYHIITLKKYLKMNIPMYSIIVFSDDCEIKDLITQSNDFVICYQNQFKKKIKTIWENSDVVLGNPLIQKIQNKLIPLTDQDEYIKRAHIESIKTRFYNKTCPKCGGNLVLRVAHKGTNIGHKFYGCSNYPKCTYTRSIE